MLKPILPAPKHETVSPVAICLDNKTPFRQETTVFGSIDSKVHPDKMCKQLGAGKLLLNKIYTNKHQQKNNTHYDQEADKA